MHIKLMTAQVLHEQSEGKERLMEKIAYALAGAGVHFVIKKQYAIEFPNNNREELEPLKELAKNMVERLGAETEVFFN